uniref:Superoxide dismutase [Cu-Zn] n=1 Tax=Strongyloides papillosus TaxID=174720 RepID=A0A0N5C9D5_STREA
MRLVTVAGAVPTQNIGTLTLIRLRRGRMRIRGRLGGLPPGPHAHLNLRNMNHGGLRTPIRHEGDLGNIITRQNGVTVINKIARGLRFRGTTNLLRRTIIVHQNVDDLGRFNNQGSLTVGNSGARIACCLITPSGRRRRPSDSRSAGHEVTVISSNIDDTLKDPYYVHDKIYYTDPHPNMIKMANNPTIVKYVWNTQKNIFGPRKFLMAFVEAVRNQAISIINDKKLEHFLKKQKFDVAIAETMHHYMFGLFKHWEIEATIVTTSSTIFDPFYPMFGIPFPTSYVPSAVLGFTDKMSYKERAINLKTYLRCF